MGGALYSKGLLNKFELLKCYQLCIWKWHIFSLFSSATPTWWNVMNLGGGFLPGLIVTGCVYKNSFTFQSHPENTWGYKVNKAELYKIGYDGF